MGNSAAPVILFAFNRADTFARVLGNLAKCENLVVARDGQQRNFYAFLDAPRNEEDVPRCEAVRKLAESFRADQCPQMEIVCRERNYGCAHNIPDGIRQVLEKHGRATIIEDDILVSRYFLSYMDEALELYADRPEIFCINAWRTPTVKVPRHYGHDVYLNNRIMCWGWGTWKDRFVAVDFTLSDYKDFVRDAKNVEAIDATGVGLRSMLDSQLAGNLHTWDIQCAYHMAKDRMWAVEPRLAMTKNIGFGGGVHAKGGRFYRGDPAKYWDFWPRLERDIKPDGRIVRQFRHAYFNPNVFVRIWKRVRKAIMMFSPLHDEPLPA